MSSADPNIVNSFSFNVKTDKPTNHKKTIATRIERKFKKENVDYVLDCRNWYQIIIDTIKYVHRKYSEAVLSVVLNSKQSLKAHKEKKFISEVIEQQTKDSLTKNDGKKNIFYWIRLGDLQEVRKLIEKENPKNWITDAAGGNCVHLSYMFGHYDVGRYLIERYPELGLQTYSGKVLPILQGTVRGLFPDLKKMELTDPDLIAREEQLMPFTGENVLHMVIMQRSYGQVLWLLDFYRNHNDLAEIHNGVVSEYVHRVSISRS
jgi:hypothetical protein